MQKEGFDLSTCMCEDCRKFKGSDIKEREDRHANSRKFFGTLGIGALILVIILALALVLGFFAFVFSLGGAYTGG